MKTKNRNSLTRRKFLGATGAALAISGCSRAETREAQSNAGIWSHQSLATVGMTYMFKLDRANPQQLHEIWDEAHVLAALQGLANRNRPTIYQFFIGGESGSIDHFWWHWMRGHDNWLGRAAVQPSKTLRHLILKYRHLVRGLVVYDEHVPSTSNVASTVAG